MNLNAVVQERKLSETGGKNFVVEVHRTENFCIRQKLNFSTASIGSSADMHRRNFDRTVRSLNFLNESVLKNTFFEV